MADNKNMELNDEMLADAAGGADGDIPAPKFKVGDCAICVSSGQKVEILEVRCYEGPIWGWRYSIKYLKNGAETDFAFDKTLALW